MYASVGSSVVFQPPEDVGQLFVPGLNDKGTHALNEIGRGVLGDVRSEPVTSGDSIDKLIQSPVGKTVIISGNPSVH